MARKYWQNQDGATVVQVANHTVTVQMSTLTTPPDAGPNAVGGDALSNWMKLDDGNWIPARDNHHMKTVEWLMTAKVSDILSYFLKRK